MALGLADALDKLWDDAGGGSVKCAQRIAETILFRKHPTTGVVRPVKWLFTSKVGEVCKKRDAGVTLPRVRSRLLRREEDAENVAAPGGLAGAVAAPLDSVAAVALRVDGSRQPLDAVALEALLRALETQHDGEADDRGRALVAGLVALQVPLHSSGRRPPSLFTVEYVAPSGGSSKPVVHVSRVADTGVVPYRGSALHAALDNAARRVVGFFEVAGTGPVAHATMEFVVDDSAENVPVLSAVQEVAVAGGSRENRPEPDVGDGDERPREDGRWGGTPQTRAAGSRRRLGGSRSTPALRNAVGSGARGTCGGDFCGFAVARVDDGVFVVHAVDESGGSGDFMEFPAKSVLLARKNRDFVTFLPAHASRDAIDSSPPSRDIAARWRAEDAAAQRECGARAPTQYYGRIFVCARCFAVYTELDKLRRGGFLVHDTRPGVGEPPPRTDSDNESDTVVPVNSPLVDGGSSTPARRPVTESDARRGHMAELRADRVSTAPTLPLPPRPATGGTGAERWGGGAETARSEFTAASVDDEFQRGGTGGAAGGGRVRPGRPSGPHVDDGHTGDDMVKRFPEKFEEGTVLAPTAGGIPSAACSASSDSGDDDEDDALIDAQVAVRPTSPVVDPHTLAPVHTGLTPVKVDSVGGGSAVTRRARAADARQHGARRGQSDRVGVLRTALPGARAGTGGRVDSATSVPRLPAMTALQHGAVSTADAAVRGRAPELPVATAPGEKRQKHKHADKGDVPSWAELAAIRTALGVGPKEVDRGSGGESGTGGASQGTRGGGGGDDAKLQAERVRAELHTVREDAARSRAAWANEERRWRGVVEGLRNEVEMMKARVASEASAAGEATIRAKELNRRLAEAQRKYAKAMTEKDEAHAKALLELEERFNRELAEHVLTGGADARGEQSYVGKEVMDSIASLHKRYDVAEREWAAAKEAAEEERRRAVAAVEAKHMEEVAAMHERAEELEEEVSRTNDRVAELERDLSLAGRREASARSRVETLAAENRKLETSLLAAQRAVAGAEGDAGSGVGLPRSGSTAALGALASLKSTSEAKIRELQNRVDYLKAQLASELTCKEELGASLAAVNEEYSKARRDWAARDTERDKSRRDEVAALHSRFAEEIRGPREQVSRLEEKVMALQLQLTELTSDVADARGREEAATAEAARERASRAAAEAELDAARAEATALRDAAGKAPSAASMEAAIRSSADAAVRRVQNEAAFLRTQLESEVQCRAELEAALSGANARAGVLEASRAEQERAAEAALRRVHEECQAEIESTKERSFALEAEVKRCLTVSAGLEDAQVRLKEQLRVERGAVDVKVAQVVRLEAALSDAEAALAAARAAADGAAERHSTSLGAAQAALKGAIERKDAAISALQQQLSTQLVKLSETQRDVLALKGTVSRAAADTSRVVGAERLGNALCRWMSFRVRSAFVQWQLVATVARERATAADEKAEAIAAARTAAAADKDRTCALLLEEYRADEDRVVLAMRDAAAAQQAELSAMAAEELRSAHAAWDTRTRKLADGVVRSERDRADSVLAAARAEWDALLAKEKAAGDARVAAVTSELETSRRALVAADSKLKESMKAARAAESRLEEAARARLEEALTTARKEREAAVSDALGRAAKDAAAALDAAGDAAVKERAAIATAHERDVAVTKAEAEARTTAAMDALEARHRGAVDALMRKALAEREASVRKVLEEKAAAVSAVEERLRGAADAVRREADTRVDAANRRADDQIAAATAAAQASLRAAADSAMRDADARVRAAVTEADAVWGAKMAAAVDTVRTEGEAAAAYARSDAAAAARVAESSIKELTDRSEAVSHRATELEGALAEARRDAAARSAAEATARAELAEKHDAEVAKVREEMADMAADADSRLRGLKSKYDAELRAAEERRKAAVSAFMEEVKSERDTARAAAEKAMRDAVAAGETAKTAALAEAAKHHEEALAAALAAAREQAEADRRAAVEAVRAQATEEHEDAISDINEAHSRAASSLSKAADTLRDEIASLRTQLGAERGAREEAEDMCDDLSTTVESLRRAGGAMQLKFLIMQLKFVNAHAKEMSRTKATHSAALSTASAAAASEVSTMKAKLQSAGEKIGAYEGLREELLETLTSHRREEMDVTKARSAALSLEIAQLEERKVALEDRRRALAAVVSASEGTVRTLENEIREHGKVSAIQDGKVNVAHTRKKKRLDNELEGELEKLSARREELGAVEAEIADVDKKTRATEESLKELESQLVAVLVDQQKALMRSLTSFKSAGIAVGAAVKFGRALRHRDIQPSASRVDVDEPDRPDPVRDGSGDGAVVGDDPTALWALVPTTVSGTVSEASSRRPSSTPALESLPASFRVDPVK